MTTTFFQWIYLVLTTPIPFPTLPPTKMPTPLPTAPPSYSHIPTVAPSIEPSSSPTITRSPTQTPTLADYTGSGCNVNGPPVTKQSLVSQFLAFGDTPYDPDDQNYIGDDYTCLQDVLFPNVRKMADTADFIVHVGDIKKGREAFQDGCNDDVFGNRRDLFDELENDIDFFMVPGDNEWNECREWLDNDLHDPLKERWRKYFANPTGNYYSFDRDLPFGGSVNLIRHPTYPELLFFTYLGVAYFGIVEPDIDNQYDDINREWILSQLETVSPKALVLFGHAELSDKVVRALPDNVPVLYVSGNLHTYCLRVMEDHPNILWLTVDAFTAAPLLISILKDGRDNFAFHVESTGFQC